MSPSLAKSVGLPVASRKYRSFRPWLSVRRLALAGIAALPPCWRGCTATRDFHGFVPDQALPEDVKPAVDTRSTVLARLGTPSTASIFDTVMLACRASPICGRQGKALGLHVVHARAPDLLLSESRAAPHHRVQFDDDDVVSDVLIYDTEDGRVVDYNSRVTPTRVAANLGILEQLFGTLGSLRNQLPGMENQDNRQPGDNPGGRQN
jgi:outer membrane protein assembly factor BamE (lipoprotein component of BamABCDE complex)